MNNRPSIWTLAFTFNWIALESFGGGLSAWSREVIVRERGWITDDEFLSASAICRIMPGANQVNLAVFVGMRLHGVMGAVAAVAGLVAVPMAIVLVAGTLYLRFRNVPDLQNFMHGLAAAAVGLALSVAWRQGRQVLVAPVPVILFLLSVCMAAIIRAPLWLTLLLLAPAGFYWAWRRLPLPQS